MESINVDKYGKTRNYGWVVREDAFEMSMWNFYIKIGPVKYSVVATVNDGDLNEKDYKFQSYEEAIKFAKDIYDAFTFDEIDEIYNNFQIEKEQIKKLQRK